VAKIAMTFGALLIVLGIVSFVGTGSAHKTALIPAYFGAAITVCGVVARNPGLRMHAMHGAVLVGLLGFVATLVMVARRLGPAFSGTLERPAAFYSQLIMLILCGLFVALCVKSFIDARRSRAGDAN
jgi:hypothetical protein